MKVFPIIVGFLLLSCENKNFQETQSTNTPKIEKQNTINDINNRVSPPIDIFEILNSDKLYITSGTATNNQSKYQCLTDTDGFYGQYQLINKINKNEVGQLTVFVLGTAKNWKMNSHNQKFSEILLLTDDFMVWDSIVVGFSESKLLDAIGDKFHYKKGTLLFAEFGEFEASFTILNDTINKIRIGRSCK